MTTTRSTLGPAPLVPLALAAALLAACGDAGPGSPTQPGPPTVPAPTLASVAVAPGTASVPAGDTLRFTASGRLTTGEPASVSVSWSATGGAITSTGLYTAGTTAGTFRVVATGPGGLADTAAVTVTPAAPPPPPPATPYTAVVGDDWKRYANREQLRAADLFWWYRSEDVMQEVDLVPDATFGQVARIRFRQSAETGWAPKMDAALPQPLDKAWYRWRMKYSPGWSTVGPNPSGYANSYKVAFWLWDGYEGRGQVELSNTNEYILGFGVNQNGTYLRYTERQLPGSQSFGNVSTEWSDGEWWEFVAYYEKTGATSARQHWWKRRLTSGGAVANNPWTYIGLELTGATTPRVRSVRLGANRNKSNPSTMYISWGPWEVVDGSKHPNPFGMPWQSGQRSAR